MQIRLARQRDFDAIGSLLKSGNLPLDGVREHLHDFQVLESNGQIVGAVGLEIHGDDALLRSLVVAEAARGHGHGQSLFDAAVQMARQRQLRHLYLLTETAEPFFNRRGFARIDRAKLKSEVTQSVEFQSACPASAACMHMVL